MKAILNFTILVLALALLMQLAHIVGVFNTIIYALCGGYICNFLCQMIVDSVGENKRGTEQIKRDSEHLQK